MFPAPLKCVIQSKRLLLRLLRFTTVTFYAMRALRSSEFSFKQYTALNALELSRKLTEYVASLNNDIPVLSDHLNVSKLTALLFGTWSTALSRC